MICLEVILICLASLSAVQAIDKCGVPKHYFSIDEHGFTNCGSDCAATAVFSGFRSGNAQFVTIDMIADHYEPNDFMTLQFVYNNKYYNLNCTSKTVYRNKNANGLQCNWKLEFSGNKKYPITNHTILGDFLYDRKIKNYIYFGRNGHQSPVASSLTSLIPYNDLFPDCTEYDVLTFYDPLRLNKITLSKKKDSITVFIHSLKNDANLVDRSIVFTNTGKEQFTFCCSGNFKTMSNYMTKYGWNDYSTDLRLPNSSGYSAIGKCAITLPFKIHTTEYDWEFDFNKKPLNMVFNTTQPNASFHQSNIKFKFD